jgi:hypothetical protein
MAVLKAGFAPHAQQLLEPGGALLTGWIPPIFVALRVVVSTWKSQCYVPDELQAILQSCVVWKIQVVCMLVSDRGIHNIVRLQIKRPGSSKHDWEEIEIPHK